MDAESEKTAVSSGELQISDSPPAREILRFDEKPTLDQERERVAAILVRAAAVEDVLVDLGGRPAVFDEAGKLKFCVLLKLGYTRSMAAAQLGIHRTTVNKAMKCDPEFKRQVLQAEELFDALPLLTIIEAAQKDWRAAVWLKNNHSPHQSVQRRKRRKANQLSVRAHEDREIEEEAARERAKEREIKRFQEQERREREREKRLRAEEKQRAAERRARRELAQQQAAENQATGDQRPAG